MFEHTAHDDEHEMDHAPSHQMDSRALGIGVLIGMALGAGAALLLAPATGADTRRQLRRNARRLYARGTDAVEELRDDSARTARRLARRGMKRGRELMRDARDTAGW
jgi:gas vesicle protein